MKFVYTDPERDASTSLNVAAPIMPHPAACLCDDCMEILMRPDQEAVVEEIPAVQKLPVTPGNAAKAALAANAAPAEVPPERPSERSLTEQKGDGGATPWDKESIYVPRSRDRQILRDKLKLAGKNHAYDWWDGTSYQPHARYTTLVNCQGDTLSVSVVCPPECTGGIVLESEEAVNSGRVDELLKLYNIPSQLAEAEEGWESEGGH
jgi:hypothetical protein